MAFDPDVYLSGGTATAAPPSNFDPDAYLKASSSPAAAGSFDPNAYLAAKATPTERLQSISQVITDKYHNVMNERNFSLGSSPADDEAYIQAWKDNYAQSSVGHDFGQAIKKAPAAAGTAIWGLAKDAGETIHNIVNPGAPPADAVNIGPEWLGIKYSPSQGAKNREATVAGAVSGGVGVGRLGLDVFMKGLRGLEEAHGAITGDKTDVDNAANIALQQLKMDAQLEHFTSNPYDPKTQPEQAALFNVSSAGTQMAAIPEIPGVAKAVKIGGDFIENGAYKALGVASKLAPSLAKTAAVASEVYGIAKKPAEAAVALIGQKISDAAGMSGSAANPFTWFSAGSAATSGLFKAVDAAGNQLIATQLGQNAFDSVVANTPKLTADATAKNLVARDAVEAAQGALSDAERSGASTIPAQAALRKARAAATAANVYSHLIDQGAGMAQWIQKKGLAGMPSKLADAVSGAIQGGVAGGTIAAATAQPGDNDAVAQGISKGAFYGGVLSMLGAAGSASQGKQPVRIDPTEQMPTPTAVFPGQGPNRPVPASVKYPEVYPPAGPYRPDMPTPTARMPYGEKPTGPLTVPTQLRQDAEAAIAGKPQIAVIDGIPHDVDALAENLSNAGKSVVNAVRQENPNETFKIPTEWVKNARFENQSSVVPSDQDLLATAAQGEKAPSGTIGQWAYDENKRLAVLQFFEKGKGQQHYAVTELDPQGWQAWQEANSAGAHFNYQIRKAYPILRIHQNLWPELQSGPRENYRPSNVAPTKAQLDENKGQP